MNRRQPAAALLAAVPAPRGLPEPHRPHPPWPPHAAVASCAALFDAVNAIRAAASAPRAPRRRYTVTLDCAAPGGFDGRCADAAGLASLGMAFSGKGELVVASAPGCRAALSGGAGEPDAPDFFMLSGRAAALTLKGLDIDGGGGRTGVFAAKGGRLALEDVGIRNCSGDYGAGLMSISTSLAVKGGAFEGNAARGATPASVSAGGGAFFYAGRRRVVPPYK
jgi:hypothetical protein